jgi:hypothetical protein
MLAGTNIKTESFPPSSSYVSPPPIHPNESYNNAEGNEEIILQGTKGRKKLTKLEKSYGITSNWMDYERRKLIAYEYLCHVGEAKEWIEACIDELLPVASELEQKLRNGVILAKLTRFFDPKSVKKLYDSESEMPLNWRHSENINCFFKGTRKVGLPQVRTERVYVCMYVYMYIGDHGLTMVYVGKRK